MVATDWEKRVRELESELEKTREELQRANKKAQGAEDDHALEHLYTVAPQEKRGYLFKWQDRVIGWGGTKWSLRFVSLERGRLAYFESHLDEKPIQVFTLLGCAVQDDGFNRNRRFVYKHGKSKDEDPPITEPGAYFHVFSIYHRQDSLEQDTSGEEKKMEQAAVIPLLRFSTPSLAEKNQWIELTSEACAYCETDQFAFDEAKRKAEKDRQREQQLNMADAMPGARRGTLPPLYFAPATQRRPSLRHTLKKTPSARAPKFKTEAKSRDAEKIDAQYPPSKPMHRAAAPSYLSAEAPVQNYRGFFNLALILLVVSNVRVIVDTMKEYGFFFFHLRAYLKELSHIQENPWGDFPFVSGFLLLQVFIVLTFGIEWLLAHKRINEMIGMSLHNVNMHLALVVPIAIVWHTIDNPAIGAALLLYATMTWMKLISYVHANEDYRVAANSGDTETLQASLALLKHLEEKDQDIYYPKNITLANIYYFWLAPTLTYQIAFPRTPRVRWLRVIGILLGMIACVALFTFLIAQIVGPTLNDLVADLEGTHGEYTFGILANYMLKLAIANTYLWLLMFYAFFHLYLNLFAEVLRFGDRVFYKDWWNSSEIASYWRLWNQPVHLWLVRHVYFPSIRLGMSKTMAMFVVFFVSAICHEILVSVPFHMIRPWSFMGMMMQMPLVAFTKYLYRRRPGSSMGNIIFWLTFCVVGQPMAILMYTADFKYGKYLLSLSRDGGK